MRASLQLFAWGSFYDTTAAGVTVYPVGLNIQTLADQLLIKISPTILPDGNSGAAYAPVTFTTTGGSFTPAFTWSIAYGSLPPGMTLSSGGTLSGNAHPVRHLLLRRAVDRFNRTDG